MQGKCKKCKTRWIWDREVPLRRAICWRCSGPLQATSRDLKWPAEVHPSYAVRSFDGVMKFWGLKKESQDFRVSSIALAPRSIEIEG